MTDRVDEQASAASMIEAAEWLARLRGPSGPALAAEHAAWLESSAHNRKAFERISDAFSGSSILRASGRYSAAARRRRQRLGAAAKACGLLVIVSSIGAAGWVMAPELTDGLSGELGAATQLALTTVPGEIRRIALPGGGEVVLDTASRLEVRFDGRTLQLRLVAGRVRLILGEEPRPCTIVAGETSIATTDGTLDVGLGADKRVAIAVIEGSAKVRPRGIHGLGAAWHVNKGHWLSYGPRDLTRATSTSERADADWPSGWVEYRAVSLGEVVREANRYATVPIVVDDPRVRALEMTGRFHIADPAAFAEHASQLFGLEVVREADATHLRQSEKNLQRNLR